MKEYIGIDEMIGNLQIDFGFSTSMLGPIIKRWIYQAVNQVGGQRMIEKKVKKKISNLSVEKPNNFIAIKAVYLTNEGKESSCVRPYNDKSVWCCDNKGCNQEYKVNQTVNTFCFSSNIKGKFSHVILHYYSCPVDEAGNPLVPLKIREAIEAYVTWKYLKKERIQKRSAKRGSNPTTMAELAYFHEEWKTQMKKARGIMNAPSIQEAEEIGEALLYRFTNSYPKSLNPYINQYYESLSG